jgi:predicted secreted protein
LSVSLRVGETYTLLLEGLGSAGYTWSHETEGTPNAVSIEETTVWTRPTGPVTSNTDHRYTIAAREPGRVCIRFELRRPWEDKAKAPQDVRVVNVSVTE